jgi:hypothetical protein
VRPLLCPKSGQLVGGFGVRVSLTTLLRKFCFDLRFELDLVAFLGLRVFRLAIVVMSWIFSFTSVTSDRSHSPEAKPPGKADALRYWGSGFCFMRASSFLRMFRRVSKRDRRSTAAISTASRIFWSASSLDEFVIVRGRIICFSLLKWAWFGVWQLPF